MKPTPISESPYHSGIYCSRACGEVDVDRSEAAYHELARTLSYGLPAGHLQDIPHTGFPFAVSDHAKVPYPALSPPIVSSSDTESSNTSNPDNLDSNGPACSAPKVMDYFRMLREGPEDSWHEINQQRRWSSMHPTIPSNSVNRRTSQQSPPGLGEISNDSLFSLWSPEAEIDLSRSVSGPGKMRGVIPAHGDRNAMGAERRPISSTVNNTDPIPIRPLARSGFSQTSLGASPASTRSLSIPPEFGSAPEHTLNLFHAYASAFPVRGLTGTSATYSQKGFIFPGSVGASPSSSWSGSPSASFARSGHGTIRAKARVRPEAKRGANRAQAVENMEGEVESTPKQSLEVENGQWKIKYVSSDLNSTTRRASRSGSKSNTSYACNGDPTRDDKNTPALVIPCHGASSQFGIPSAVRTPQRGAMAPPASIQRRPSSNAHNSASVPHRASSDLPDLANLRIGSPAGISPDHADVLKSGFSWEKHALAGGITYELPKGLKVDCTKRLFFFN